MGTALFAACAALLLLIVPAHATDVPIGGSVRFGAISSGGRLRAYRVFVPSAASSSVSLPVVFVLHGGLLGTPFQVARNTGFDDEAEARGFLAVYPWGFFNTWNAGTCCGPAMNQDVDDVGFIRDLLDDLAGRYRVDAGRVYATGISNGGMLSYRLGCELSDRIAAIAPVAATMTVPCSPAHRVSVLHIHGLEDHHVPYEGGVGTEGFAKDYRPPVPDAIARWRAIDECPAPVTTTDGVVSTSTSDPCADGTAVTLVTIANAGHTWPGGREETALGTVLVDPPNNEIDATAVISAFFRAHAKP
jgi:polyhydroxybutyrate depolymerase